MGMHAQSLISALNEGYTCVCVCVCVCAVLSYSVMSNSATLWTVACQAPLSMGFSRQEYWSGLPFLPPSWPRDQTWASCIGRWILYHWVTWKYLWLKKRGSACSICWRVWAIRYRSGRGAPHGQDRSAWSPVEAVMPPRGQCNIVSLPPPNQVPSAKGNHVVQDQHHCSARGYKGMWQRVWIEGEEKNETIYHSW